MRAVIWFILLFGAAVVASSTLGANDGLVSIYGGSWRFDMSLNLFLLLLLGSCFALVSLIDAVNALVGLPERARLWRVARRDRSAQAALREALAEYFGARYGRAHKAAVRTVAILDGTPELDAGQVRDPAPRAAGDRRGRDRAHPGRLGSRQ